MPGQFPTDTRISKDALKFNILAEVTQLNYVARFIRLIPWHQGRLLNPAIIAKNAEKGQVKLNWVQTGILTAPHLAR